MRDMREFWDFSDPAGSEIRFQEFLPEAGEQRLEVIAQIARTHSLRNNFDEADEILEQIQDEWETAPERARVGYYLEKGRCVNSGGDPMGSKPYFEKARDEAENELDLKIDAIHMLGIAATGEESLNHNLEAIALAKGSEDPKARRWLGSLLNNTAWSLHDLGRYDEALTLFEDAVVERDAAGHQPSLRIAKWAVARCKRSLGRFQEALDEQMSIFEDSGRDGYALEEIGENLWSLGHHQEAAKYFDRAAEILSNDPWARKNESDRISSMKARAQAKG